MHYDGEVRYSVRNCILRRLSASLSEDTVCGCTIIREGTVVRDQLRHTTETIGVLQFLRECIVKTDSCVTVATDSIAGKSMASRVGVSRASTHILLRYFYVQGLGATGVVRLREVNTKLNLADLHTKYWSVHCTRYLSALHRLKSSVNHYMIQCILRSERF